MGHVESTRRIAVDIGGTFTDVVLDVAGAQHATKVLTTASAPERGVITGITRLLDRVGVEPCEIGLLMHGTTLATNAIIERKGAVTAFITTQGFRDVLEIADEGRFDQYDLFLEKPRPLVPRRLRFTVPQRVGVDGCELAPLDESAVIGLIPVLESLGVESVAVGFLHAYGNASHEKRVRELLQSRVPAMSISLSSEVCPEIREYERFSTTCANAYVQPLMASYLQRLGVALEAFGLVCPVLLMTSGGGLATLDTAIRYPIRLVESGPAGGAILATRIAREGALDKVLSFDMGGTTAKICLVHDGRARTARNFEVDRAARFTKGSGLPLRIPVIEMVEIGAGGGSIARLDALGQITVGPDSAGSDPGPVCYARSGEQPTVTDADLVLGRIDADDFAGGSITLDTCAARGALSARVGSALRLSADMAAYGVAEMVDEMMANAARVHAVERGEELAGHTLIAFGGAAPLHAARLAEKLSINRVLIPANAGVGSAVGMLAAPIAYQVVRSRYLRVSDFDAGVVNALLAELREEAWNVVSGAVSVTPADIEETRVAYMRYVGQGHEIAVQLPLHPFAAGAAGELAGAFSAAYTAQFARTIPGADIEVLTWTVTLSSRVRANGVEPVVPSAGAAPAPVRSVRRVFDPVTDTHVTLEVHAREDLSPGMRVPGPCIIAERDTSTFVSALFQACPQPGGALMLERVGAS